MSEYQKNVMLFGVAVLMGIAYICIGLFVFQGGSEDQRVFVVSGIGLLVFCGWFLWDALL